MNGDLSIIYMGIIDILQSYRLKKKIEHTMKSFITDGVRAVCVCVCVCAICGVYVCTVCVCMCECVCVVCSMCGCVCVCTLSH